MQALPNLLYSVRLVVSIRCMFCCTKIDVDAAPWISQQLLMCNILYIWILHEHCSYTCYTIVCVATKLILFILDSRCSVSLPFPEHDTLVVLPHLLPLLESDVSYTCQTVWTLAQIPLHSCAAPGIHPSYCPNNSSLHSRWWLPGFTISSTVLCGTWPTLDLLFTCDAYECSHCNWGHHAYFDLLGCTEGKQHFSVNTELALFMHSYWKQWRHGNAEAILSCIAVCKIAHFCSYVRV